MRLSVVSNPFAPANKKHLFSISRDFALSRYLIFFSMLYMSVMIGNAILTNRYISLDDNIFVLGNSLISPLTFILADIVAEIFGYRIAKQLIFCGFICEMLLASVCWLTVHLPYPVFFTNNVAYLSILGSLYYVFLSSFFAFVIAGLVNVSIITRWKQLFQSRYFWLRSLGSSTLAEALYTMLAILMIQLGSIPLVNMWESILFSYLLKVAYSIIFSGPGSLIVNHIKKRMQLSEQEYSVSYNPFKKGQEI